MQELLDSIEFPPTDELDKAVAEFKEAEDAYRALTHGVSKRRAQLREQQESLLLAVSKAETAYQHAVRENAFGKMTDAALKDARTKRITLEDELKLTSEQLVALDDTSARDQAVRALEQSHSKVERLIRTWKSGARDVLLEVVAEQCAPLFGLSSLLGSDLAKHRVFLSAQRAARETALTLKWPAPLSVPVTISVASDHRASAFRPPPIQRPKVINGQTFLPPDPDYVGPEPFRPRQSAMITRNRVRH